MVLDEATRDWLAEQCGILLGTLKLAAHMTGQRPTIDWRLVRLAIIAGHELRVFLRSGGSDETDRFEWFAAYVSHYCEQTCRSLAQRDRLVSMLRQATKEVSKSRVFDA